MAGNRPNSFRLGSYSVRWTRQIVWSVAKVWGGSVKAFSSYGILYFFIFRVYLLENGQKPKKQQKTPETKLIFPYFDIFEKKNFFQNFFQKFFSNFFSFFQKFFKKFSNFRADIVFVLGIYETTEQETVLLYQTKHILMLILAFLVNFWLFSNRTEQ